MLVQITLVGDDPDMIAAWRATFADRPEVEIVRGSLVDREVDAWAVATRPDGALDPAVAHALGPSVERALRESISERYGGALPLGHAACVASERCWPRFVIATPAPNASSETPSPLRLALAVGAALQAVHAQNAAQPGSISAVALASFGAGTGLSAEACAELTWTAYELFRAAQLPDYPTVRAALERLLADPAPASAHSSYKRSYARAEGTAKATVPDNAAAQAQLKMKLERARTDARGETGDGDD